MPCVAIDLRRNVWEASKKLKSALDHVEEIDDEDEVRILREPMDALQVYVKKALQSKYNTACLLRGWIADLVLLRVI